MKKKVIPSPKRYSPYRVSTMEGSYLTADAELEGGDPFVGVQRGIAPAVSALALTIGRQSDKELLNAGVISAAPSRDPAVSYDVTLLRARYQTKRSC